MKPYSLQISAAPLGAVVLLFTRGVGMEAFLDALQPRFAGVPMVGGAVAWAVLDGRGMMTPVCTDVAAVIIDGSGWRASTVLFHKPTGIRLVVEGDDPRTVLTVCVDGKSMDARAFIESAARDLGIADAPLDRLALLAGNGQSFHMSEAKQGIQVCANLSASHKLELAVFDQASDFSLQGVLKHRFVQAQISNQLFEPGHFALQFLEPTNLSHAHSGKFLLPPIERLLTDAQLPTDLLHRYAVLSLTQRKSNLLIRKSALLHDSTFQNSGRMIAENLTLRADQDSGEGAVSTCL